MDSFTSGKSVPKRYLYMKTANGFRVSWHLPPPNTLPGRHNALYPCGGTSYGFGMHRILHLLLLVFPIMQHPVAAESSVPPIRIDTSETPHLSGWASQAKETMVMWYPIVSRILGDPESGPAEPVNLVIQKRDKGIAGTVGREIRISSHWVEKHPGDLGMVVHELVHVIQAYPEYEPGWITEGIADYIRWAVYEKKPADRFPRPQEPEGYRKGYQVTAGFFLWLESGKAPGIVARLNHAMRNGDDAPALVEAETGRSLDELWAAYLSESK